MEEAVSKCPSFFYTLELSLSFHNYSRAIGPLKDQLWWWKFTLTFPWKTSFLGDGCLLGLSKSSSAFKVQLKPLLPSLSCLALLAPSLRFPWHIQSTFILDACSLLLNLLWPMLTSPPQLSYKFLGGKKYLVHFCHLHRMHAQSLSRVRLFATLWSVTHQAPLSMGFSRQENCHGLPFPTPGNFLTQGLNLHLLSLLYCRQILHCWATGEALSIHAGSPEVLLDWFVKVVCGAIYFHSWQTMG